MVCVFCFQNEFPTLEIPHSKFKKAATSKIFFLFCTPSCITLGRTIFQKLLHWSYFANFPNIAWIAWFPNRTASTGQRAFCTVWPEKICASLLDYPLQKNSCKKPSPPLSVPFFKVVGQISVLLLNSTEYLVSLFTMYVGWSNFFPYQTSKHFLNPRVHFLGTWDRHEMHDENDSDMIEPSTSELRTWFNFVQFCNKLKKLQWGIWDWKWGKSHGSL